MAETPDLDALARQYLDLWQEQLSALGAEGEMAESIAKSIELMNVLAAAFANMAGSAAVKARDNDHDEGRPGNSAEASRTAPVGPALKHSDPVVDQLTKRIAQLEKRIAKLEPASKKRRK